MVRDHYRIAFEPQGFILSIFHPVTTEVGAMPEHTAHYFDALLQVGLPVVAIFPNNDSGNEAILARLQALAENPQFRIFPSVRFEAFLSILKHARCIAGNSSAGVREAPFYGVPSVDVGTRQTGRYNGPTVLHADYATSSVVTAVQKALTMERGASCTHFGDGSSVEKFYEALHSDKFWKTDVQKMYHAND
jgi:UDP-N-acetylglucosamine 2-epimerase (hydrolysing)